MGLATDVQFALKLVLRRSDWTVLASATLRRNEAGSHKSLEHDVFTMAQATIVTTANMPVVEASSRSSSIWRSSSRGLNPHRSPVTGDAHRPVPPQPPSLRCLGMPWASERRSFALSSPLKHPVIRTSRSRTAPKRVSS